MQKYPQTREEYLGWRKGWRREYKTVSDQILTTKAGIKYIGHNSGMQGDLQRHRECLRCRARNLMLAHDATMIRIRIQMAWKYHAEKVEAVNEVA